MKNIMNFGLTGNPTLATRDNVQAITRVRNVQPTGRIRNDTKKNPEIVVYDFKACLGNALAKRLKAKGKCNE